MITLLTINLILTLYGIRHWKRHGNWLEKTVSFWTAVYTISWVINGFFILLLFVGLFILIVKYLP